MKFTCPNCLEAFEYLLPGVKVILVKTYDEDNKGAIKGIILEEKKSKKDKPKLKIKPELIVDIDSILKGFKERDNEF